AEVPVAMALTRIRPAGSHGVHNSGVNKCLTAGTINGISAPNSARQRPTSTSGNRLPCIHVDQTLVWIREFALGVHSVNAVLDEQGDEQGTAATAFAKVRIPAFDRMPARPVWAV
ncbi:MAG: hypothetical protein ACK6D7_05400, partial [Acidobacteriota bacterium]